MGTLDQELKRSIDLKAGIFVIRYAIAEEISAHPAIKVSIDEKSQQDLFLILHDQEGLSDVTLWRPGSSIALKAVRPGRILVEVVPVQADASTNATIKIDPLYQGEDSYETLGQAAGQVKRALDLSGLRLHGHVAGRGDVEVAADEWLAGPAIPARIEGIAIEWTTKPRNIDLRYCAIGPRSNAAMTPMVPLSTYVGTRGRALPVLGFNIELTGTGANGIQMVIEALFLGTPVMRAVGERLTLSGPSGLEPLIGLKISFESKKDEPAEEDSAANAELPSEETSTRPVRVFRSKARTAT